MDTALLRLLLAVLHDYQQGPEDEHDVLMLWNSAADIKQLDAYCERHRPQFELFSDDAPFYQAAGLDSGAGTKTIAVLVPHIATGNSTPWFNPSYFDNDPPRLSPAEAARWLVHAHAYDTGGTKTPYNGRGQAGNRRGPLTYFPHVTIEGSGLADTLRLNLVLGPLGSSPPWRQNPLPCERVDQCQVEGRMDMLTWQSRRILLLPEDNGSGRTVVRWCVRTGGDQFPAEHVSMWATHEAATMIMVTSKNTPRIPEMRSPAFRMFGGLVTGEAALPRNSSVDPRRLAPPVVQQTAWILAEGILSIPSETSRGLSVSLTGYHLDQHGGSYQGSYHETMPLPARLLREWWVSGEVRELKAEFGSR